MSEIPQNKIGYSLGVGRSWCSAEVSNIFCRAHWFLSWKTLEFIRFRPGRCRAGSWPPFQNPIYPFWMVLTNIVFQHGWGSWTVQSFLIKVDQTATWYPKSGLNPISWVWTSWKVYPEPLVLSVRVTHLPHFCSSKWPLTIQIVPPGGWGGRYVLVDNTGRSRHYSDAIDYALGKR